MNPLSSIIRQSTRRISDKLNILTAPTHERYESGLCQTGHNFYAFRGEGIKDWNCQYGNIPENYVLLDPAEKHLQVPNHVEFDLVLSQNKFGQFQNLQPIARLLNIPLVSLEHTLPMSVWSDEYIAQMSSMRGNVNVFISEFSLNAWNWDSRNDTTVIHHMIDTGLFQVGGLERQSVALSIVNDWINRDHFCGFKLWQQITQDIPVRVIGDTPGLSEPAKSTEELIQAYQSSQVFLNTSLISPIPTSLLEAMSCGCACVSTATCMIPEIIQDGINGFISNDPGVLKDKVRLLLNDSKLARKLGNAARQTILDKFNKASFLCKWDNVFRSVT